jgi:hypothetical protein
LLFNFAVEYVIREVKKMKSVWNWMGHISYWAVLMILIC